MFPVEAFRDSVLAFAEILNRLSIPFHLTGGITSLAYGEPRMTQDVDVVIDPSSTKKQLAAFIDRLDQSRFLFDPETVRQAVMNGRQFQLLDGRESLKFDVYPRELIAGELQRSYEYEVFTGSLLPIVSLADAVLSKLIWVSHGSHKSRRDIRQLVRLCNSDELSQVRKVAAKQELADLLQQVLEEADEIDL